MIVFDVDNQARDALGKENNDVGEGGDYIIAGQCSM